MSAVGTTRILLLAGLLAGCAAKDYVLTWTVDGVKNYTDTPLEVMFDDVLKLQCDPDIISNFVYVESEEQYLNCNASIPGGKVLKSGDCLAGFDDADSISQNIQRLSGPGQAVVEYQAGKSFYFFSSADGSIGSIEPPYIGGQCLDGLKMIVFVVSDQSPPPPTGVTAVQDGPTSITVTWTPPSPLEGTTGYRISYATGSDVDIDGGSTNSYTLTGLTNGQTYTISIVAIAPNRPTSSPIEAQVTLVGVPEKPTVDTDNIETTITISWSLPPDTTGSEVSWELTERTRRRQVSNAEGGTSGPLAADQNSYTIDKLRSGTSYDITVTVFNPAGGSSTTFTHSAAEDSCRSDSSALVAALGGVLGVVIVTATVVQAMVIVFFMRKLQRAKCSTNTGVEMSKLSGKNYL
ncbi:hypothetical protein GBAR_LOCUS543 [Geodia barretti]|nr:hypothetical protein GBAR_LOCUS543 [Geodia barretti]